MRSWRLPFVRRALLVCLFAVALKGATAAPTNFTQSAYVWNRSWTSELRQSVTNHANAFDKLVVLVGEVTWKQATPQVSRVAVDFDLLRQLRRPVGLALRVGPFSGPFDSNQPPCRLLVTLAQSFLEEAHGNGVQVAELQLDFDCAQSKLAGYRSWVQAVAHAIRPLPLIITVLPVWLGEPEFGPLAASANGFVLQVHSLERPRSFQTPFTLCDPAAARRAVQRAAGFGRPFCVALPTYGYRIAFDKNDRFIGLAAEGVMKPWPADARVREVMADPIQISSLVQEWATNRPGTMQGLIWYRLPVETDTLCWHWKTLSAMMHLRPPQESLRAEARRVEAGLVEISLINEGDLDISSRLTLETRWSREGGTRLLAGDGLQSFEMVDAGISTAKFQPVKDLYPLRAGDRRVIGWLRFNRDCEVQIEIRRGTGNSP